MGDCGACRGSSTGAWASSSSSRPARWRLAVSDDLFTPVGIDAAVAALERDLTSPGGPSISTMRNHNFAILVYAPAKEFQIRQRIRQMTGRLESEGWSVLSIALHQLVLERVRALGPDEVKSLIDREKR